MKTKTIKRSGYILETCIHNCKKDELKIKSADKATLYIKDSNPNIFRIIRYLDRVVENFCKGKTELIKTRELLILYREIKNELGIELTKEELELDYNIKESELETKLNINNSETKPDEFMLLLLKFDSLFNGTRRFRIE